MEEEIEESLLEEYTDSDQSISSDDDDSSDDVQCATASSAPSASSATFTWEDMTNYVGQRENFLDTVGLKMKPKMKLTVLKCSKCFLMKNWWN